MRFTSRLVLEIEGGVSRMWFFTIYGFFSVACLRDRTGRLNPDQVMIRARSAKHLNNLQRRFPAQLMSCKIQKWPGRDYGFRIIVEKKVWAECVGQLVMEQDWSNFKDAAGRKSKGRDAEYTGALHAVWATMLEVQEGRRWRRRSGGPVSRFDEVMPYADAADDPAVVGHLGSVGAKGYPDLGWDPEPRAGEIDESPELRQLERGGDDGDHLRLRRLSRR